MLSSVCSVHGAMVIDAEVEEVVVAKVVVGGVGDKVVIAAGVVTAKVVLLNGWSKSPIGPDTVVTGEQRSDSVRLTIGLSFRQSGESQT